MKIKFNKKDFLKAIKIGGCFASKRTPLPILQSVKVQIVDNTCWLLSYNDKNAIKTHFKLEESYKNIEFCIDKDDIENYVSLLMEDYFDIDVDNEKLNAIVSTPNSTMNFPLHDVRVYPTLAQEVNCDTFTLDANLLGYWIQKGMPLLEYDEFQPNNQHLHLFIKDNKVDVFAFNFDKMYHDSAYIDYEGELKVSIDMSAFAALRKALSNEQKVTIKNGEKNIIVIGDNSMLLIRKYDFKPLDFYMLLKYQPLFEVEIDKKIFHSIVSRAIYVQDDTKTGTMTLNFDETGITFVSENMELNKKLEERVEVVGGKEFKQTFILQKLLLVLNSISSDKVVIRPCGQNALFEIGNTEYTTESGYISPCRD